jgi:hypothetical protein
VGKNFSRKSIAARAKKYMLSKLKSMENMIGKDFLTISDSIFLISNFKIIEVIQLNIPMLIFWIKKY